MKKIIETLKILLEKKFNSMIFPKCGKTVKDITT